MSCFSIPQESRLTTNKPSHALHFHGLFSRGNAIWREREREMYAVQAPECLHGKEAKRSQIDLFQRCRLHVILSSEI